MDALEGAHAEGETRLTKIAWTTNLPYDRFITHLEALRDHKLIDPGDATLLTEEGRRLLAAYRQWRDGLRRLGLTASPEDAPHEP